MARALIEQLNADTAAMEHAEIPSAKAARQPT
jgi:hypothetical protein